MIIGISGKRGSGKDTVGMIFKYFAANRQLQSRITVQDWIAMGPDSNAALNSPLIIKKFAGKLKDIVSILTNIPRPNLESEKVKNTVLPPYWTRWKYEAEVGPIKYFNSAQEAEAHAEAVLQDRGVVWFRITEERMTVREMLQWVGTEAMREQIHPNIWVNALMADYLPSSIRLWDEVQKKQVSVPHWPMWVVTDVRFPNEAEAINTASHFDTAGDFRFLIRVERPGLKTADDPHPSETALDNYTGWDAVINNDCDLDELVERVRGVIQSVPNLKQFFNI